MGGETHALDREAAAALLGWWLESGVDTALAEAPTDWRLAGRPAAPAPISPPGAIEPMPDDHQAFLEWLGRSPELPLNRPGARRVLPRGEANAEVMVMTDMASLDDDGQPIGGEAWQLAKRMLAAIGFAPEQAYLANLSCFSSPGAKLAGAELERCAEIALHHIALAAPKRLILFGDGPSKALLGGTVAQERGKAHKVEGVRTIATFAPGFLLKQPANKALAWRDLLLLMEE